jgi:hypothetical protein
VKVATKGTKINLVIWLAVFAGIGLMIALYLVNGLGSFAGPAFLPTDAPALTVAAKAEPDPAGYILVTWTPDNKDVRGGFDVLEYAICRKNVKESGNYTVVGFVPAGTNMFVDSNSAFANVIMPPGSVLVDGGDYLYQVRTIMGQKPVVLGEVKDRYPDPKKGLFFLAWDDITQAYDMNAYYALKLEWFDKTNPDPQSAWTPVPDVQLSNLAKGVAVSLGEAGVDQAPITFRVMGIMPSSAPNFSKDMVEPVKAIIPGELSCMAANLPDSDGGKIDVMWVPSSEDSSGGGDVWEYAVFRAKADANGAPAGKFEFLDYVPAGETMFNDYSDVSIGLVVPDYTPFTYKVRSFDFSGTATLVATPPPVQATENLITLKLEGLPGYAEASEKDEFLCYLLERSDDGMNWGRVTTMLSPISNYMDVKVQKGKTYYYRVRALNKLLGDKKEVAMFKQLPVQKLPQDQWGIPLDWSKAAEFAAIADSDNLYKIKVERAEWAENASWHTVALLPPGTPQWADSSGDLNKDQTYQYRISALMLPPVAVVAETAPSIAAPEGINMSWMPLPGDSRRLMVERKMVGSDAEWQPVGVLDPGISSFTDTLENGLIVGNSYQYKISTAPIFTDGMASAPVEASPTWFKMSTLSVLVGLIIISILVLFYISRARKGADLFIRRISGLEAVQEAVGRATEMGKSILYVPGIGGIGDLQTIASLVILGRVARMVADYETSILVPCNDPIVMSVAQETIKEAFSEAGRPDSFRPDNVRFITTEQFAYVAGVDGIMLRDRPAATFFLGVFYAESLILAETGHSINAIQIAGTAMPSQIPFFVVACDYTLIGEELYAASAYLSREPRLLGSLLGQDWGKVIAILLILIMSVIVSISQVMGVPSPPPNVKMEDFQRSFTPSQKWASTMNKISELIRAE